MYRIFLHEYPDVTRDSNHNDIQFSIYYSQVDILRKTEVNYIRSFFPIFLLGTHRGALLLNISSYTNCEMPPVVGNNNMQ